MVYYSFIKYQYLFTHKPLLGADKYIIIDRRDTYAWCYSHYMTHTNKHVHGEPPKTYTFDHSEFKKHEERGFMFFLPLKHRKRDSWNSEGYKRILYR